MCKISLIWQPIKPDSGTIQALVEVKGGDPIGPHLGLITCSGPNNIKLGPYSYFTSPPEFTINERKRIFEICLAYWQATFSRGMALELSSLEVEPEQNPPKYTRPERLLSKDVVGAGLQIHATLSSGFNMVEFSLKPGTHVIASAPWVQFPPSAWEGIIGQTFKEMVDLWNAMYSK